MARAQVCPQIIANGTTLRSGRIVPTSRASSPTNLSTASTTAAPGVRPDGAPCNTPPSILVAPVTCTIAEGAPFVTVEYCSTNYNIDMGTNSVKLNGVVIDLHGGTGTMLSSQNPDTLPNSGFCGASPHSGKTAQEIGRARLRPGTNTLLFSVCDDIGNCASLTTTYTYTPNFPVAVTPDDTLIRVFSAQPDSALFVVRRSDADTTTGSYTLTRACIGTAVPSCTSASSITLTGAQSKTVAVYFTGGSSVSRGRVVLTATLSTNAATADSGADSVVSSAATLIITPKSVALNAAVNAHNTAFYTATNLGPLAATFTFTGTCTGADTACVASPNRLLSVAAPRLPSRTRLTMITTSGGRITAIKEPDSTVVGFGYIAGDTNRIVSRTDRNGVVGTFTYNAAKLLVRDSIAMDTTGLPIVTTFRPYESVGWAPSSVDTALTYGVIDGPRTDVGDTTLFWLDQFQEPRRIRNALGQDTKLTRGNTTYPALVTRMQAPNGRVLLATYDGHGNIATSTDSGTCLAGTCATTTYLWDQKWDFVRKVTAPLGEVSLSSYDQTYGNKDWQSPDADSANHTRRVSFTYDTAFHLPATVQEPLIAGTERMWYDGAGNLDSTKTPTNIPTRYYLDSLGRDTLVKSAIDYGDTTWVLSKTTYDVSDEDVFSRTSILPLRADSASILHGKSFDAEGNVMKDSVMTTPDLNTIGWVSHVWTYDHANRKRTEFPQGILSLAEQFTYDPAGNVVSWQPRQGFATTTTYDALNRPLRRVVPGMGASGLQHYTYGTSFLTDTLIYTYDLAGNMLTANNVFAKISRAYNLNGTLAADTERVRESDSASTAFSHVYGIAYRYDLENRRAWMVSLSADSTTYAYDATTGLIKSVRDPYGNRFAFAYDAALRLATDTLLAGSASPLIESRVYDNEGRMSGRHEVQGSTTLVNDSLTYDARNKRLSASFLDATGSPSGESNHYAKLGPTTKDFGPVWNDTIATDGLGREHVRWSPVQGVTTLTSIYDHLGTDELYTAITTRPGSLTDTTSNLYDGNGSLFGVVRKREIATQQLPYHLMPYYARQTVRNRYGSDLKLMASETHFDTVEQSGAGFGPQTYYEREEYRYDALGRRIWRRLVRPAGLCDNMNKASGCLSMVERTVWDGDQVLWEIRADGGDGATSAQLESDRGGSRGALEGRVVYTHGGSLDHPLSIGRLDAFTGVIVPQYDYRGNAIAGTCIGTTICTQLEWPEQLMSPWEQTPPPSDDLYDGPKAWAGNLIDTHKDGSGYVYMRNRYYDPSSGRFTQTDPIGLAGGLNAYGFANGDPVNFSDPFGLCPDGSFWCPIVATTLSFAIGGAGEAIGATAGAAIGLGCGPAAEVCSPVAAATFGEALGTAGAAAGVGIANTLFSKPRTVANGGRPSAATKRTVDAKNEAANGGSQCCEMCGKCVDGGTGKDKKNYGHTPTPFSKGGGAGSDNIEIECAGCNQGKGNSEVRVSPDQ